MGKQDQPLGVSLPPGVGTSGSYPTLHFLLLPAPGPTLAAACPAEVTSRQGKDKQHFTLGWEQGLCKSGAKVLATGCGGRTWPRCWKMLSQQQQQQQLGLQKEKPPPPPLQLPTPKRFGGVTSGDSSP